MKKHIVCLGDSNTHGSCANTLDCEDGLPRFNENERWTCRLQKALGDDYLVLEEGLSGRTMTCPDPLTEGIPALDVIYPILMTHEPVDLLIIMLGTNDTKDRFGLNAPCIAKCMERLLNKAKSVPCWGTKEPNILVICPPHIRPEMLTAPIADIMGQSCVEKSQQLAKYMEPIVTGMGFTFMDAEGIGEMNTVDFMHLSRAAHAALAEKLAKIVPSLV